MSKPLRPICYYINDREEMVNQMFSTMKEDKLRAMLPPTLKGMAVDELKKSCLEELLGMSSKRIQSVVAGQDLLSSSDSEDLEISGSGDDDSASAEDSDSATGSDVEMVSRAKDQQVSDYSQKAIKSDEVNDLDDTLMSRSPKYKTKHAHKTIDSIEKPNKSKQSQKPEEMSTEAGPNDSAETQPEKTLLEMLELELRARAIRAALNHQEKINLLDNQEATDTGIVIEIKEEDGKISEQSSNYKHVKNQESESCIQSEDVDKLEHQNIKKTTKLATNGVTKQDNSNEFDCEEISSDENMLVDGMGCHDDDDDGDDDGEPVVIEPVIESIVISSDSDEDKTQEIKESWKERWMRKKDIATVMKASKLLKSVKQKMKRKKTDSLALQLGASLKPVQTQEESGTAAAVIQGTVSEFNLLQSASSLAVFTAQSAQDVSGMSPVIEQLSTEQMTLEESNIEQLVSGQSSDLTTSSQPCSLSSTSKECEKYIVTQNTLQEDHTEKIMDMEEHEPYLPELTPLLSQCESTASTSKTTSAITPSTDLSSSTHCLLKDNSQLEDNTNNNDMPPVCQQLTDTLDETSKHGQVSGQVAVEQLTVTRTTVSNDDYRTSTADASQDENVLVLKVSDSDSELSQSVNAEETQSSQRKMKKNKREKKRKKDRKESTKSKRRNHNP